MYTLNIPEKANKITDSLLYFKNKKNENAESIIKVNFIHISENLIVLENIFRNTTPLRFEIQLIIPEDVKNACITLNNEMLIWPFSNYFPDGTAIPEINNWGCNSKEGPWVSTLKPGSTQNISFRWSENDILKVFLYY